MDPPKQEDKKEVQGGFTPLPPQDCTSNPNQADLSQQQPKHPSSINILTSADSHCVTNNTNNYQTKQALQKQYKSQLHSQSMLSKKIADVIQKNALQMKQADKYYINKMSEFIFCEDGEDVNTLVMLRPVEKMPTNLLKDEKRPKLVCIDEADNFKASPIREIKQNIQETLKLQTLIVRSIEQLRNEIHKTSEEEKVIVFTRHSFHKEQIEELQVKIFIIFCQQPQQPIQKLHPLKKGLLRYVSKQQQLIAIIKQHKIEKQLPNFLTVNPFQIGASNLLIKVMHSMLNQNISNKVTTQILNHFKELALILAQKSEMYEIKTSSIYLDNFIKDVKNGQNIIQWYTTQQPFYKILNNLLRSTRHPAQSYYVQPYFKKLYQQIQKMFKQAVEKREKKNFTCYRGCSLTLQQIQHYTKSIGEVIISLGFLSTSEDQEIAEGFGNSLLYIKVDEERINEQNCPGYASISSRSNYWLEREVLFNPLNSFMITAVTKCKVTKKDIIHLKYGTFSQLIQCKNEEELTGTHYYHFKTSDQRMEPILVLQQAKMMKSIAEMQKEESTKIQCEGDTLIEGDSNLQGCEQYWWKYKDINEKRRENLKDIKLWGRLGEIYKNKGEYDKSLQFYEQSRKIKQKKLGKQHVDYAATLNNMAGVYSKKGEYDKSLQVYEQSRKIQQKKLGKQHVDYAATLNNMAGVYSKKGEYDKSLQLYEQSRKIKQKKLGKQHVDYAVTLNNMAVVYKNKGEYDKSLQVYEQSRKIQQKKLGREHVDYAATLNNMAGVYSKKGEYDKSLQFYEQSRRIQQKKLGREHVDYAATLNNMAVVYQNKGEYDKSLQFYEQSRRIQQKKLGKEHVDYAATLNNMAGVHSKKGEYDKSLQVYEQSRRIQQKKLGREHVDYAATLNNMAGVHSKKGEYDKSLQFYQQSRKIQQKKLGKYHVDYAATLYNIGSLCYTTGKYDKSLQFFLKSKSIYQKNNGIQPVQYANVLIGIGSTYQKMAQFHKAVQLYQKSLLIVEQCLGSNHRNYKYFYNKLYSALYIIKIYDL